MTHQFRIWGPVCLAVMLLVGATSAKALPSTVAAQRASLSEAALPRLVVSPNGRFIQGDDGSPFFWMGDTVWSMLHHSTRAEAEQYLLDRQARGFNVIVASVISEAPLTTVTGQGCLSLSNNDPLSPNECYFAHIDWVVARAAELGIYVALVPTWGDKVSLEWGPGPVIFTPENARPYGRMLATRYQSATNVVWVLGGDRLVRDQTQATIWNEIATGLTEGLVAVGADPLIYYHPPQFWRASDTFHENPLFDLNAWQSGHSGQDVPVWEQITQDYNRVPAKPVFDSEPPYEDHPVNWGNSPGFFRDYEVRRQVYRSVFAGGFGVNYGNHAVWQWYAPGRTGIWGPERFWYESLGRPGATQMLHLRRLMESRPFFTRIPDQRLLVSPQGSGINHVQATRDSDGSYAMVYIPSPQTVTVDMSQLTGGPVAAWWYDPRTGSATAIGTFANSGTSSFTPPGSSPDWVLVLDDTQRITAPPGSGSLPPAATRTATTTPDPSAPTVTATATRTPTATATTTPTPTATQVPGANGASFYRGLNLGGNALTLDGNPWGGRSAASYSSNGTAFCNQSVVLTPATEAARAEMLRCSLYGTSLQVALSAVPNGSYEVYLYVWEDNASETFSVRLEGQLVQSNYVSGAAGRWARLGPWPVSISDGAINLASSGGWANFSGVEVWQTNAGTTGAPSTPAP